MSNKASENYLDNLLNSINGTGSVKDSEDELLVGSGGKGQDDFLREFEDELEADAYDKYISDFEFELDSDYNKSHRQEEKQIQTPAPADDDESLEDLLSRLDEEAAEEVAEEADDEGESIEDLTSAVGEFDSAMSDMGLQEELPLTEIGEPDLAGNSDGDLLDILGQDADLSDIGSLLSDEAEIAEPEGESEFDKFASSEMEKQEQTAAGDIESIEEPDPVKEKGKSKEKKEGFFARLKKMLFGPEEDENAETLISSGAESDTEKAAELSAENEQILKELEAAEKSEDSKGKKGKKDKKKDKKPAKDKKAKPPKEKKKKAPKEKRPKEKDNTPKLPKGPVRMIVLMVASLFALVIIATMFLGNASNVSEARDYYNEALAAVNQGDIAVIGNYGKAYEKLNGLSLKGEDEKLYNKLKVLAPASFKLESYGTFYQNGKYDMALDSLICAAGRCDINQDDAEEYGCTTELQKMIIIIDAELTDKYGMTYDDAVEMYSARNRREYTRNLLDKLEELGLN